VTLLSILLTSCLALPGQVPQSNGSIEGVVINATSGKTPAGGAEVMLRMRVDGQFVPVAQTTADENGKFRFKELYVGREWIYMPGANRHEIHYPGERIELTRANPNARIELEVCDSVSTPNPLVIRKHEIEIRPESGAVRVTETILVDNPSKTCFVGKAGHEGSEPVTLQLSIPSNFERTTFYKEFFGRRFSLVDGKLVTSIPWTPGKREVKFTYLLANSEKTFQWQRPVDLPCDDVRIVVHAERPDEVACSLERDSMQPDEAVENELVAVTFLSDGDRLPPGKVLEVQLGHLPLSMMAYGRWAALAILLGAIGATGIATVRRRRGERRDTATDSPSQASASNGPTSHPHAPMGRRKKRRKKAPSRRTGT